MLTVEINGLTEPIETTVVDENYRPITPEEAGIDPDYEAYWAARESLECDSDSKC